MNILFMGTPDFAEKSLKAIDEAGYNIVGVVTNPDRPKGRGMKLVASPVKEYALKRNFKIFQPERIRNNPEFIEEIKKIKPDLICVVAYGKILPQVILDMPELGCINVHGSLLPKYRGAAPIQWAVLNGDKTTGITTMYMDIGMDTGDMILKKEVEIDKDETTGELWDRLADIGGELLVETIKKIEDGTVERIPQPEGATIAPMLEKKMSQVDWKEKTDIEIKNLVRGLNPIMGAYSFINNNKLKFWKVDVVEDDEIEDIFEDDHYREKIEEILPGTILFSDPRKGLYVKAKKGIVKILEIQGQNARKMDIKDYLRGNELLTGSVFEYIEE